LKKAQWTNDGQGKEKRWTIATNVQKHELRCEYVNGEINGANGRL